MLSLDDCQGGVSKTGSGVLEVPIRQSAFLAPAPVVLGGDVGRSASSTIAYQVPASKWVLSAHDRAHGSVAWASLSIVALAVAAASAAAGAPRGPRFSPVRERRAAPRGPRITTLAVAAQDKATVSSGTLEDCWSMFSKW